MIDITSIVTALIALLSTIVTGLLIPLINQKISAEKRAKLAQYAEIGVKAAEQLYKNGTIGKGDRKKYVLEYLAKMGLVVDVDEVSELIESIVLTIPHTLVDTKVEKDE